MNSKIDRRREDRKKLGDRSLVHLTGEFGIIDRYKVDHPQQNIWT